MWSLWKLTINVEVYFSACPLAEVVSSWKKGFLFSYFVCSVNQVYLKWPQCIIFQETNQSWFICFKVIFCSSHVVWAIRLKIGQFYNLILWWFENVCKRILDKTKPECLRCFWGVAQFESWSGKFNHVAASNRIKLLQLTVAPNCKLQNES